MARNWARTGVAALGVLTLGVVAWELMYVSLGGGTLPVVDDVRFWVEWRERVRSSKPGDLVLIGASRMQLGIDIATLKMNTGRAVYQLAIDGTSPLPVLFDLAADSGVRGNIVVSLRAIDLLGQGGERAREFVRRWEASAFVSPAERVERWLEKPFYAAFSSRAHGVRPETLYALWRGNRRIEHYLRTFRTREREADYSLVNAEALRHFRFTSSLRWYRDLAAADKTIAARTIEQIRRAVQLFHERGSTVVFVELPISEELLRARRQYLPDSEYLGLLEERVNAPFIHFHDHPELQRFQLPDGSHLDRRDQQAFTEGLAKILSAHLPVRRTPDP